MKKNISKILIITLILISGLFTFEGKGFELEQNGGYSARVYFQHVENYEDGSAARFTGCVTSGGSCWTEGPEVDQDCLNNGVWEPCGWE